MIFTTNLQNRFSTVAGDVAKQELTALADKYPGRALFATRFSPEDQVVAHLIFSSKLPLRVFTYSGADQHDILVRSVDFFKANIEVSFQQARLAAAEFAANHPEVARAYEQHPATAPLGQVLQGNHLLISSRRRDPFPLEWDEANQRAIFYPLLDWTEQQVQAYLQHYEIPHPSVTFAPVPLAAPSTFSVWVNTLQLMLGKRQTASLNKQVPLSAPRPKQFILGFSE